MCEGEFVNTLQYGSEMDFLLSECDEVTPACTVNSITGVSESSSTMDSSPSPVVLQEMTVTGIPRIAL